MALTRQHTDSNKAAPEAVRAFLTGTVIGVLVVGGFCAGAIMLFGGSLAGALAVGGFCALWGGPGFGGMMGFVLHQDRVERRRPLEVGAGPTSPLRH